MNLWMFRLPKEFHQPPPALSSLLSRVRKIVFVPQHTAPRACRQYTHHRCLQRPPMQHNIMHQIPRNASRHNPIRKVRLRRRYRNNGEHERAYNQEQPPSNRCDSHCLLFERDLLQPRACSNAQCGDAHIPHSSTVQSNEATCTATHRTDSLSNMQTPSAL